MAKFQFERAIKLEKYINKVQIQVKKLHDYIVRKEKNDESHKKRETKLDDLKSF